ncbi:hypothetical protein [Anabaena sp. PCC 7108]|uniref:hypothetical protein n=1 Tax=Anabaena sp. PCC 7108 TaxID=163908 RepID=UPI0003475D67|nr:hypothetical protein [Anabaena sp. PCC 7108]
MIKIQRDIQGRALGVSILINNIYYPLPFVSQTKTFDFEAIQYSPTRESLRSAWQDYIVNKDPEIELADRPDLALNPLTEINWMGFASALISSATYNQIIRDTTDKNSLIRLEAMASAYAISGDNPATYPTFFYLWSQVIAGLPYVPSTEVITQLNEMADVFGMRFTFDVNCLMLLKINN